MVITLIKLHYSLPHLIGILFPRHMRYDVVLYNIQDHHFVLHIVLTEGCQKSCICGKGMGFVHNVSKFFLLQQKCNPLFPWAKIWGSLQPIFIPESCSHPFPTIQQSFPFHFLRKTLLPTHLQSCANLYEPIPTCKSLSNLLYFKSLALIPCWNSHLAQIFISISNKLTCNHKLMHATKNYHSNMEFMSINILD